MSAQLLSVSQYPSDFVHSADLRSSSSSELCHLPSSVFDLILCFLPFHDKLDHCSHLSKRIPPWSAAAFRHDELHLTAASATRLSNSPRLLSVLSQLSSLTVLDDWTPLPNDDGAGVVKPLGVTVVRQPTALTRAFRSFSALSCLTIRCPTPDVRNTEGIQVPVLYGSQSTIRSLAIESSFMQASPTWLLSTISPLSALRHLCLAVVLHPDCLNLLLRQPLHILDLSGSRLSRDATPDLPAEKDWTLAASCRVLRLPKSRELVSDNYLDSVIERWPAEMAAESGKLHTLAINHVMSHGAAQAVLAASAAPRTLSIAIEGHKMDMDPFLPLATATSHLASLNIHLRVFGPYWRDADKVELCLDFLTRHSSHVRSLTVHSMPAGVRHRAGGRTMSETWLTQQVLARLAYCTRLQSIVLQTDCYGLAGNGAALDAQTLEQAESWPQPVWLPQLRSLSLANVAEDDLCQLIAASPSLEYCRLDLSTVPAHLFPLLAASCPKLKSLHVRSKNDPAPHTAEELAAFRSLTSLTLHGSAWWVDQLAAGSVQPSLLSSSTGSPVRQLQWVHWFSDWSCNGIQVRSLVSLLLSLPQLRVLMLCEGDGVTEPPPTARWDDEASTDDEEQPTVHLPQQHTNSMPPPPPAVLISTSTLAFFTPSTQHSSRLTASPLQSLEICMPPDLPCMTHLATLLSHTPQLTSITITLRAFPTSVAATLLHTVGVLGMYAPSLVTLRIVYEREMRGTTTSSDPLDLIAVRSVTALLPLPPTAFGRLRHVQQLEVRAACKPVLSVEALQWIQSEWLVNVPMDGKSALVRLMAAFDRGEPDPRDRARYDTRGGRRR